MADEEVVHIDGRAISSLRVVDLRKECDKRGLSKSGSKGQLVERLKTVSSTRYVSANVRHIGANWLEGEVRRKIIDMNPHSSRPRINSAPLLHAVRYGRKSVR